MIRVVTEATLNDSLNQIAQRTKSGGDIPLKHVDVHFTAGHYIVEHDEGGPYIVIEGPIPDEAYDQRRCPSRRSTRTASPTGCRAWTLNCLNEVRTDMGDKTKIEWTDATWNPVRGCTKVSAGCDNCYAMTVAHRFAGPGQPYEGLTRELNGRGQWNGKVMLVEKMLDQPLRWKKPRRIFVNSMSDLFHPAVPFDFIGLVFAVMSVTTRHTYQVLTKRPGRMREFFKWADEKYNEWWDTPWPEGVPWKGYDNCGSLFPFENVWLGVSVEDQATAEARVPLLMETPAAVRWVSCEPLLGAVDLTKLDLLNIHRIVRSVDDQNYPRNFYNALRGCSDIHPIHGAEPDWEPINWVVVGGESGAGSRPMHPAWARSLRDQCRASDVPFLFKQWGDWFPTMPEDTKPTGDVQCHKWNGGVSSWRIGKRKAGRELDGQTWDEYPQP